MEYETVRIKDKDLFRKAKMRACEKSMTMIEYTEYLYKEDIKKKGNY